MQKHQCHNSQMRSFRETLSNEDKFHKLHSSRSVSSRVVVDLPCLFAYSIALLGTNDNLWCVGPGHFLQTL